jgi:hypothetical protein
VHGDLWNTSRFQHLLLRVRRDFWITLYFNPTVHRNLRSHGNIFHSCPTTQYYSTSSLSFHKGRKWSDDFNEFSLDSNRRSFICYSLKRFVTSSHELLKTALFHLQKSYNKSNLSLCLIRHHSIKAYGEVEVQLHGLLTSATDEYKPGTFYYNSSLIRQNQGKQQSNLLLNWFIWRRWQ